MALIVGDGNAGLTKVAVGTGGAALVDDGLRADRPKPVFDAAVAGFDKSRKFRMDLDATRRAQEERKTIDRATSVPMKARGLDEAMVQALLRRMATDLGREVVDVAAANITAPGLPR